MGTERKASWQYQLFIFLYFLSSLDWPKMVTVRKEELESSIWVLRDTKPLPSSQLLLVGGGLGRGRHKIQSASRGVVDTIVDTIKDTILGVPAATKDTIQDATKDIIQAATQATTKGTTNHIRVEEQAKGWTQSTFLAAVATSTLVIITLAVVAVRL